MAASTAPVVDRASAESQDAEFVRRTLEAVEQDKLELKSDRKHQHHMPWVEKNCSLGSMYK